MSCSKSGCPSPAVQSESDREEGGRQESSLLTKIEHLELSAQDND